MSSKLSDFVRLSPLEAVLVAVPLAIGVYYSLHKADYFKLAGFVGLDNYVRVVTSPIVRESLLATFLYTVFSLAITLGVGFALALWLERRFVERPARLRERPHHTSPAVGALNARRSLRRFGL